MRTKVQVEWSSLDGKEIPPSTLGGRIEWEEGMDF